MVDMHIHSENSDGEYKTSQIIEMLKRNNIDIFSITDHDNIDSYKEIKKLDIQNMIYIPGVEFSSVNDKYNCHILGYNIDCENKKIIEECEIIKKRKQEKIKTIINYLENEEKIYLTTEEQTKLKTKKGIIGRYDICKILIDRGYGNKKQIYDRYLTNIKNMKTHRSNIETITQIIKEADGISILAHPKKIEEEYKEDIENIIKNFIEKGIDGIEVYNSVHTLKDVKRYLQIAKKYNLLITGGSDFHGKSHPERVLGTTTQEKIKIKSSNIKLH
jgi:hypothetical protein